MKAPVKILGPNGQPIKVHGTVSPQRAALRSEYNRLREIQARYDAAQHTEENARAWMMTDGMSARAANSKEVRRTLRWRARYEVANNSYARGIVTTLANDTIGTGPRLHMQTPDQKVNRRIEREFMNWSRAIHLAEKLRTMRMSLAQDGEAFGLFINNYRISTPVQLDLMLIEADQFSTPFLNPIDPLAVDGIRYDLEGNPVLYSLLRRHPGDVYQIGLLADYIDARSVIHWFRRERPGQRRGIPDLTPALDLFNQLRRYTLAVLAAAETAADHAAILYSELPPDVDTDVLKEPITLEIERRVMTTLPMGWKMSQFKAEQPATTYEMFKNEILKEICRCIQMPFNVAAGDSSNYNYASGRLDHQTYHKSIHVDQSTIEILILDRVLQAWIDEAWLATNWIPGGPHPLEGWPHQWFWDGYEHVDPMKEAQAQERRLCSNTTTLADEYARKGQDWEPQIIQRGKEIALLKKLGLPTYPTSPTPLPPPIEEDGQDGEESDELEPDESEAVPQEGD